jgi:signal transduction histidine kinase
MMSGVGVRRLLPVLLLGAGLVAFVVTVPVGLSVGRAAQELPWMAGMAAFLAAALVVWLRQPDHPIAGWFAMTAGTAAIVQTLDVTLIAATRSGDAVVMAWLALGYHIGAMAAVVLTAHLLGLFPDGGEPGRPVGRRVLTWMWVLLVLPALAFVSSREIPLPGYHLQPAVPNPYAVAALEPLGGAAGVSLAAAQGAFVVGVVLLVLRYRRAGPAIRRRIRWLLLPGLLAAAAAAVDFAVWQLFPDGAQSTVGIIVGTALWIVVIVSLPVAVAIALLRPNLLDVDRMIRKSLVYGLLWALIAMAYVGAAAGLGVMAGRRLPLGVAIGLTVLVTMAFQPARRWLEQLADRWVFGARTDPTHLIARLGAALEETVELERLLPRMADTLREGLGLRWARVRLEPAPPVGGSDPVLSVPIVLEEERIGVVECGPKESGPLTADDEAVVATLARQAALAVRNVRLTAELEASRARLVRAQDAERRRIERNIHDGVQQDLVALIGHTAHVRRQLERDPAAGEAALGELQDGLRHLLGELRALARGIHPSLLSDRGLLDAVEALAARSAVPVFVRADPMLRGQRFAAEIEGAGYFAVAEALANVGKHARASRIELRLSRSNGALHIAVGDDGVGFDPVTAAGDGLTGLAERLSALGGHLDVNSEPGRGTTVTARLQVSDG